MRFGNMFERLLHNRRKPNDVSIPSLHQIQSKRPSVNFAYARGSHMYGLIDKGGLSYEAEVTALLLSLLGSADKSVFLDVGANIGYFPILMGGILGNRCEITAFEPSPMLFSMCKQGLENNNIDAKVCDIALSDSIGKASFYLSAQSDTSNSLNPDFRKHKDEFFASSK